MSKAAEGGSITSLLAGLGEGDEAVLAEIWRRFFPRMAGLARSSLAGMNGQRIEADDVAQSAFISFWRTIDEKRGYQWNGRDDLWRLLATITARKARKRVRREMATKRGAGRSPEELHDGSTEADLGKLSPVELDAMAEEMLLSLNERRRSIALGRLQGWNDAELADRLNCSQRTIERELASIRKSWSELFS